jgi:hypothetical protein
VIPDTISLLGDGPAEVRIAGDLDGNGSPETVTEGWTPEKQHRVEVGGASLTIAPAGTAYGIADAASASARIVSAGEDEEGRRKSRFVDRYRWDGQKYAPT